MKRISTACLPSVAAVFVLVAACLPMAAASADKTYPVRPVRMVVPNAPGGGTDIIARVLSARFTETLGQSVIVDNRGGGSAIIGSMIVAKATPDGYTLMMATNASHAINVGLFPDLPYDPLKDFTPVAAIAGVPSVLVVAPAFPVKTAKDFIAYGIAQDGKLNHGSSGTGGTGHLTAEIFKTATGMRALHVPYKSDGPALIDLMGGQLSFTFANMPAVVSFVKAGRLRALAITSAKRSPVLPEAPTLLELGLKVEIMPWYCVVGPAGLPKALVATLKKK